MTVAVGLAEELEPDQLTRRLTELAVPARLRTPEGRVLRGEPATPRFGQVGPPTALLHPRVERTVKFGDGTTLTVFATRAGLDATLRRLLLVLALGSAGAVVVAAVLWRRVSATVIARRHARTSVQLELACANGSATVRVRDDGPGITIAERERIFERFASLDGKGGSGLGMRSCAGMTPATYGRCSPRGRWWPNAYQKLIATS